MTRVALLALILASCIPDPVRAPACSPGARRCTPTGLAALCAAGEWVADESPQRLRCAEDR